MDTPASPETGFRFLSAARMSTRVCVRLQGLRPEPAPKMGRIDPEIQN